MKNSENAGEIAARLYSQGYNCAKSAYAAVNIAQGRKPKPDIMKLCTAFGGGIGRSGSICGALVGAEFALAEHTGTAGKDNFRNEGYRKAAQLFSKFRKKFGAVDCRVLKPQRHCKEIVSFASLAALGIIKKK